MLDNTMCGGFTLHRLTDPALDKLLGKEKLAPPMPNYNVRPLQNLPILVLQEDGFIKNKMATWGFEFKFQGKPKLLINAQLEKLGRSFWSRLMPCLIPANGFYEWKKVGGKSVPHYFKEKQRELFLMAGLFQIKQGAKGYQFPEFVIMTCPASPTVKPIHHRMPVIVKAGDEKKWLQGKSIQPYDNLISFQVSDAVNYATNNSKDLIYPLKS